MFLAATGALPMSHPVLQFVASRHQADSRDEDDQLAHAYLANSHPESPHYVALARPLDAPSSGLELEVDDQTVTTVDNIADGVINRDTLRLNLTDEGRRDIGFGHLVVHLHELDDHAFQEVERALRAIFRLSPFSFGPNPDAMTNKASLAELERVTVNELTAHRHDPVRLRQALARFFSRGTDAHLSTGELVDLLGVSSPSLLERAGFSDDEAAFAVELAGDLAEDEIAASLP